MGAEHSSRSCALEIWALKEDTGIQGKTEIPGGRRDQVETSGDMATT